MRKLFFGFFLSLALLAGCTSTRVAILSVTVAPSTATVEAGGTASFTATVKNDSSMKGVTWTVSCSATNCGSVSPTTTASGAATTYTAPAAAPSSNLSVTITATSVTKTTKSGSATITVPAITVSVSPASATVQAGGSQMFTPTVMNDPANAGVTWSVSCSVTDCGSVSPGSTASGTATTYSAPATPPLSNLTVTVTATSATDGSKTAAATVTVPAVTVSVAPASATVQAGGSKMFTATVSNTTDTSVTWSLTQSGAPCAPACGTLSSATANPVTYNAPATPPASNESVTIVATSVADATKSGSAAITVPAITVSVSPATANVEATMTQAFTATVNNTSNTGVVWSLTCTATDCGMLSSTTANPVTYTGPAAAPSSDLTVTIKATSSADATKSGSATITVPAITVSVSPASATVLVNATQNFTATVANDPNSAGVTWSLSGTGCSGATCGALTNVMATSVTYTAPSAIPSPATVTLTATSKTDTGKSGTATITVTAGVNNAELNGHYAFRFSGFDDATSGLIAMAGSIVADGAGAISSGEVARCQGPPAACASGTGATITGTYTIGADNRGTLDLTFTPSVGTPVSHVYAFAVGSISSGIAHKGRFIEFDDSNGTTGDRGSGVIFRQDTTAFTQGSVKGNYAFDLIGVGLTAERLGIAGVIDANGSGTVTGGTADQDDAGTVTNSISITGSTYTAPDAAGVGTFSLTCSTSCPFPTSLKYVVVDSTHLLLIATAEVNGEALLQTSASFTNSSISGNVVFYFSSQGSTSGDSSVSIGVATASGSGSFTSITEDDNDSGSSGTSTMTTITYSVASNGRVTTAGGGSHNPIFYLVSPDEGFFLGTNGRVDFGFFEPQSGGPFSTASVSGNYFIGATRPVVTGSSVESGVVTSTGNGSLTGSSDESDPNGTLNSGGAISATLTVTSSTLGRMTDLKGGVYYIISLTKFVRIDTSSGTNSPTITIVEK
jgi:C4-type Zn-finger protein